MACGCQKNQPRPEARNAQVPAFGLHADAPPQALGPDEVLVTWKIPSARHAYVSSLIKRGRTYDRIWREPFAMLKADATGRFQTEITYVAP